MSWTHSRDGYKKEKKTFPSFQWEEDHPPDYRLDIFRSWMTVPITLCRLRGEVQGVFFSRVPWHVKQYIENSQMSVIYMLQILGKFLIFRRLWGPTLIQTKVISDFLHQSGTARPLLIRAYLPTSEKCYSLWRLLHVLIWCGGCC